MPKPTAGLRAGGGVVHDGVRDVFVEFRHVHHRQIPDQAVTDLHACVPNAFRILQLIQNIVATYLFVCVFRT